MEVYRYLTMDEILDYVNGRFDQIGREYTEKSDHNSHRYTPGQKYVHFFKNLNDLEIIQRFKGRKGDMLIAKFDIPFTTLVKHMGVGYYESSGYDIDHETIREFAIPTTKLKRSYLVAAAKDKDGFLTPERAEELLDRFVVLLHEHREKKRAEAIERGEE